MSDCVLCSLNGDQGHPEHPEARRCGSYDYEALKRRQIHGRQRRAKELRERGTGCFRKVRWNSPEPARKEAKRLGNPSIHAYWCRDCGGFHVGKGDKVGA